jgi:hypothetical protein
VQSCLPSVVDAIGPEWSAVAGTPAGMVVVRAAGLRVRGGTVTAAGNAVPARSAGPDQRGQGLAADLAGRRVIGTASKASR